MAIGLAVRRKRVGEASDLGSTTVEVPKPFVKEVSNEGNSLTTSLVSCQGRCCALLEQALYAQVNSNNRTYALGVWGRLAAPKIPLWAVCGGFAAAHSPQE